MSILITGMHRSGTSMVAHTLRCLGVDLGPDDALISANDANLDGYWEHREVVDLHDELLRRLGGSWENPPELGPGWHRDAELDDLRARARAIVETLGSSGAWGWKDPRASLVLPFWLDLVPDAHVVVCIRDPLEVAYSLKQRSYLSPTFSLGLWQLYNTRLLADAPPERTVVTHYEAWLRDARAEVARLAAALALDPDSEAAAAAAAVVKPSLRHHVRPVDDLAIDAAFADAFAAYDRLCELAELDPTAASVSRGVVRAMQAELATVREREVEGRTRVAALEAELAAAAEALERASADEAAAREAAAELRMVVGAARDAADARDDELRELRIAAAEREATLEVLRGALAERETALGRLRDDVRRAERDAEAAAMLAKLEQVSSKIDDVAERVAETAREQAQLRDAVKAATHEPVAPPELVAQAEPQARTEGETAQTAAARFAEALETKRQQRAVYEAMKVACRAVVAAAVPEGASVAVVSRGDDDLVALGRRTAWHFPCEGDGAYAGFYPANDRDAIAHLESVRARGAQYLVVPATALWWLTYYERLAAHLSRRYRLAVRDASCVVYDLRRRRFAPLPKRWRRQEPAQTTAANGAGPTTVAAAPPAVGEDTRAAAAAISASGLFDEAFYRASYPDACKSGADALEHFCAVGWTEGRQPNAYFDTSWYLGVHGDALSHPNPLVDYIETGEKRRPSPLFDPKYYAGRYLNGNQAGALADYLAHVRRAHWRDPVELFDVQYYLEENHDVRDAGIDPALHYLHYGFTEGRDPSRRFSTDYYRRTYLPGDSETNPLVHYYSFGEAAGHDTLAGGHEGITAAEIRFRANQGPAFQEFDATIAHAREQRAKAVAFYLPQFHAIPENDEWWGTGFTEWRNLARGVPRFRGHYQPRIPRDLGFYDLADKRTLRRQVELARAAGLYGFGFYYYWFNGKRLLERPLEYFLSDPSLGMNFCVVWANENWTRRWDGQEHEVLLRQDYDDECDVPLVDDLQRCFADPRYIRIDGRPLVVIYRVDIIPEAAAAIARWRKLWRTRHGEKPLIFLAQTFGINDPRPYDADGAVEFPPHKVTASSTALNHRLEMLDPSFSGWVFDYAEVAAEAATEPYPHYPLIKTAVPSWDNDARRQGTGTVLHGSTPALYEQWLRELVDIADAHPVYGERFVFVNAWNEWAEGAYLEPDVHFGSAYLNATARAITVPAAERPTARAETAPASAPAAASKRKILLVGHDAHRFGAQINLWHMGELIRHQFGCEVAFLLQRGGDLLPDYEKLGTTFIADGGDEWIEILHDLRREGFDAALVNSVGSGDVVPYLRAAGYRTVSLVHELPGVIEENNLQIALTKILEQSDCVVVPARVVAEEVQALAAADGGRIVVRPQGLYRELEHVSTARARVRRELGIPADAHVVVNVGSGDLRKGVDTFIHVAKTAVAEHPALHFVWVGKPHLHIMRWLQRDLAGPLAEHVHFVDYTDDVATYFSAADAFFLTSREDPYPSVVLEALHMGLPVIALAGSGGIDELVAEHGRVVEPSDTAGIVRALSECVREDDAAAVARRRSTIAEKFRFDDYCFDLLTLLDPTLRKVSVVVPNFNYRRHLAGRLDSIFAQSYPVFEIVVLDDCSTDGSVVCLEELREKTGRRFDIVRNDKNSGSVFRQWRNGVRRARGDYVWIAEADDLAREDFLERVVPRLRETDAVFGFSDSAQIDEHGAPLGDSYREYYRLAAGGLMDDDFVLEGAEFVRRCLAERNLILNVSAVVWQRDRLVGAVESCFGELRSFRLAGDWYLYAAAALEGGSVVYVAESLSTHRRHGTSMTGALDKERHLDEIRRVHGAIAAWIGADEPTRARMSEYRAAVASQFGLAAKRNGTAQAETTPSEGPPDLRRR